MNTLEYTLKKYNLDGEKESPLKIPGGRYKELPQLFKELGFSTGVEIGVLRGKFSKALCRVVPGLKLYSIDPWRAYKSYGDWKIQQRLDLHYEKAKVALAPYKNCKIIKEFSMEAVKDFEDESLDFVFIDGNHSFKFVTEDIYEWSKKVRKGGIISGHDFERHWRNIHVRDVVQAWTYSHRIKPWFVIEGVEGDRHASFMWVK